MFLNKSTLTTEIVSAKSSEMNICVPKGDDYVSSRKGREGRSLTICSTQFRSNPLTIVHGFRPETDIFDFLQKSTVVVQLFVYS